MTGLFSEADLDPAMIELERKQLERERTARLEAQKLEVENTVSFDKKLYIIDGYSIIYRSYFAHLSSPLLDIKGRNCSAYFGFFQTLFALLGNYDMDYLAVTMDEKAPTFRHLMYPEYKANREKAPEDLHEQVPMIIDTLQKMKITVLSRPGFEADDIIASLSRKATENAIDTIMVTGDKDLCQLIGNHVYALRPPKKGETKYRLFGTEEVKEEYGVYPNQIVDYLTLLGDSSDNVPGIKGIGEKGAVKLLTEYVSFDGIYRHLDSLKPTMRKRLEEGRESGELSKKLVTLSFDALVGDFDFSTLDINLMEKSAAVKDFEIRKMFSLARRAGGGIASSSEKPNTNIEPEIEEENSVDFQPLLTAEEKESLIGSGVYSAVSLSEAESIFQTIAKDSVIAIDFLTTDFENNADVVGFSFAFELKKAYFVPIKEEDVPQLKVLLDTFLASGKLQLTAHNVKFHLKTAWSLGSDFKKISFDTMITAWLNDSNLNQYSLSELVSRYFNHTTLNIDDLMDKGASIKDISPRLMLNYSSERADYAYRLYKVLDRKIKEKNLATTFYDYELPLIRILAKMEVEGIYLSDEKMEVMKAETDNRLSGLVSSIYKKAGHEFNINSTMQLGKVLFEEKGLTTGKKTQKGFSTDTATLEAIRNEDSIVDDILEYRLLNKLKTTYIDTLPALRDKNGRIHTTFLQTGTATGRLSSRNPNLQNIPIRTDEGRLIRGAFVPTEGNVFLSADYSQIELVVLAYMTDDPNLKHAFNSGEDVHKYTASTIFGKDIKDITPHERRISKTINFGIMYGMSAFRLSNELGISRTEATEFIKKYFNRYSGVRAFVDKTVAEAAKTGYIKTKFGHIRDIVGINSSNKLEKAGAERVAVNSVIQGTAAEIMKKAMIDIATAIDEAGLRSKMILQVHDELIFEVPTDEKDVLATIVRSKMENAVKLTIPLKASLEFGTSWGDMH